MLLAALLLAVAPLHVLNSHYVKHDVPVTFLIVLAYSPMTGSGSFRLKAEATGLKWIRRLPRSFRLQAEAT